jgi:hypothetical protein
MFRLAGENDAESIFEIQGTGSIPAKELQDILILKVLVVPAVGMGFQYTFSKFSECMSLAMLEKRHYYFFAEQLCMMVE